MTARTVMILMVVAGVAVSCIIAGQDREGVGVTARGDDTWRCNIAGTYLSVVPPMEPQKNAAVVVTTLVPLDPLGIRLKMVEEWVNGDSTFMGMFPEADMSAPVIGEAVKTGHDTYDFSIMGYGGKKVHGDRAKIQFMWGEVGSLRIVDCDTIETYDLYVMLYNADQDKDLDGLPDRDEKPAMCMGPLGPDVKKRMKLMAPCVPEPTP